MSADLITCPAPLGMLRPGSPVVTPEGHKGIVVAIDCNSEGCCLVYTTLLGTIKGYHFSALEMDLGDATGRAHATWWVAEWCARQSPGCRGTGIHKDPRLYSVMPHRKRSEHHRYRAIYIRQTFADRMPPKSEAVKEWGVVPALAHLDPTDKTRLPDGSRRVDALALKAVVEHRLAERGER